MQTKDLKFTAVFEEKEYTVTWNIDGKETVKKYKRGKAITKPAKPKKDGYVFRGWVPEVPETMPAENLEFKAMFEIKLKKLFYELTDDKAVVTGSDKKLAGAAAVAQSVNGKPVTEIGAGAFENCTSLTGAVLPVSIEKIGERAFSGCTKMTAAEIPKSVKEIGKNAFAGCTSLAAIYFEGTKAEWGVLKAAAGNGCLENAEIIYGTDLNRKYEPGDVDGSGNITAADARLVLRAAVGLEAGLQPRKQLAADVDGNPGITAADARLVLRAAVGIAVLTEQQGRSENGRQRTP